jgi:hypothetical protein
MMDKPLLEDDFKHDWMIARVNAFCDWLTEKKADAA